MGLGTEGCRNRPARLHSLAELVPWNRFLGIDSLESILGLLKSLKIQALSAF